MQLIGLKAVVAVSHKKIIYVDMDNVIADYTASFNYHKKHTPIVNFPLILIQL